MNSIESYNRLLEEISSLYEETRLSVVTMYWHIGRYIVEVEQKNNFRGEYGESLIERLSRDLSEKYGKGFSMTNLRTMRLFFRAYSIRQLSGELDWSHYVALLTVKDEKERKSLEERAIKEKIGYKELRKIASLGGSIKKNTDGSSKPLPGPVRGLLNTYGLIAPPEMNVSGNLLTLDCGFNIRRDLPVKDPGRFSGVEFIRCVPDNKNERLYKIEPADDTGRDLLYTFKAVTERIVDGDTLWVDIQCGPGTRTRQKLRLRSIDTPELDCKEGKKAKRFVEQALKGLPFVVVKTYKSDKYDRYLTDLFFMPGEDDAERVAAEGRFLNGELVERGLAVVV
jgi:endonuclease YncB( thermonuclease family)